MTPVEVALQPIVCADSFLHEGFEALARLGQRRSAEGPEERVAFGKWAELDLDVLAVLRDWGMAGNRCSKPVYLNLAPESMALDDTFDRWLHAVEAVRAAGIQSLVIEISERTDGAVLDRRWDALLGLGAPLALDDFGRAEAGRERLELFRWDICKFEAESLQEPWVHQAIEHCRERDIELIAEKVEKEWEWQAAREQGLRLQQGYLFGKPRIVETAYSISAGVDA